MTPGSISRRLGPAAAMLLALALFPGCDKGVGSAPPEGAPLAQRASKGIAPQIGFTAPDFELPDLKGGTVRLSDLRGRVVLLNFWATWCGPCRVEMPTIQAVYEDYGDRGLSVLAVAGDYQGAEFVAPFMRDLGLTFPGLLDERGEVQDLYFVNALPMTFLLDRNGVVVNKLVGFFDWNLPRFRGLIEALLDEA